MFDSDSWKEIGATLARNKTRTFLTAFGIFWGTAMLTLLWGGSRGLQGLMLANFEGFATNSAICFPNRTTMPYKGYQKGMNWGMTQTDVDNIRRLALGLEVVSPIISNSSTAKYKDKTYSASVMGLEPNYAQVMAPKILDGRFLTDADVNKTSKVCVLGKTTANNLFGDADPLGQYVECDNIFYRVVGIIKKRNDIDLGGDMDQAVIIPISTMRRSYNMGNRIHFLTMISKPGYTPSDMKSQIIRAIRIEHPIHPDDENAIAFWDISEMFQQAEGLLRGMDILFLFVGLSSLIAGIIGVGNIMWIVVKERTKEFGIRRAIGAKPRTILWQILQESAVLTAIAGTAGICFAVGILAIATHSLGGYAAEGERFSPDAVNFQITFVASVTIMLLFLILGGAAGSIPAYKAMKIKPIEALNDK